MQRRDRSTILILLDFLRQFVSNDYEMTYDLAFDLIEQHIQSDDRVIKNWVGLLLHSLVNKYYAPAVAFANSLEQD